MNAGEKITPAPDQRGVGRMTYALEYSIDGQHWRTVPEKRTYSDCPGTGIRNVPVTRERLQDIQREAEFWSHRYPHIRIKHPEVRAPDMRDSQAIKA